MGAHGRTGTPEHGKTRIKNAGHSRLYCAPINKGVVLSVPPQHDCTWQHQHHGGEGGIRTLEALLTLTRFPVVRPRPS